MKLLIAFVFAVVFVACQAEDDVDTAVTSLNNPLQRFVTTNVRQAYLTSNVVHEGYSARQYLAGHWTGPQRIWNTTFTVRNGLIVYTEAGAGSQYYIIKVQSKPGLTLSWEGEIWTYV